MSKTIIQSGQQLKRKPWSLRKKIILALSGVLTLIALYFILPILLVVFVAQPVKIEGQAMSPTLNDRDRVFVSKSGYSLERGDIVVFYYPHDTSKSFIKRLVGLPGETISMNSDGQLYINGEPTNEPYLRAERNRNPRIIKEQRLGPEQYYVMGDNRDASNDSRSFGPVSRELIYGKVVWRYWPPGKQFR
jgi:signal peptidase I